MQSQRDRLYLVLVSCFVTALIVADLTAGKFFQLGPVTASVGLIPFPLTFILTDIVNEYYGKDGARRMTLIGLGMLVFAVSIVTVARLLPTAAGSPVPAAAFEGAFGLTLRLVFASLTAYVIGQFVDIHVFQTFKNLTREKHLWLRATGSTAVSQIIDTTAVNFLFLAGVMPLTDVAVVTGWSYLYKLIVAITLTPVCYAAHSLITDKWGIPPAPPAAPAELSTNQDEKTA